MSGDDATTDPTLGLSSQQRIHQACEEFIASWKRFLKEDGTERPAIEEYLERFEGHERKQLFRELLDADLHYRRKHGESPNAAEYMDRFPKHLSEIESGLNELAKDQSVVSTKGRLAQAAHEDSRPDELPPKSSTEETPLPNKIGRYEVRKLLGQGTFGSVYLAYDGELDRDVAIKVQRLIELSPEGWEAFRKEARILAELDHPHIVPVFDAGQLDDGRRYAVSKLIVGTNLAQKLLQQRMRFADAAELLANVADALHHAHRKKLVHRDIKPANILVDAADNPYVVDFGLVLTDADFGDTNVPQGGTVAYMSPEQARMEGHRIDGRSDIFSLGVVMYELLTGERPFVGKTLSQLLDHIKTVEARPPRMLDDTIPRELERICLKALEKPISNRYTTAFDLASDLRDYLSSLTVDAKDPDLDSSSFSTNPNESDVSTQRRHAETKQFPDLTPYDFSAFLREKRRGFCGREWLFETLDEWAVHNDEQAILIVGDPGAGKSTFAAEFVHRNVGGQILAFHFCQAESPATLEPWRIILSLAAMISGKLPSFSAELHQRLVRDSMDEENCRNDPICAFESGIIAPLTRISPPDCTPQYLVFDALDEAVLSEGPVNLVELLTTRLAQLPEWLRIIATTRDDPTVMNQLEGLRVQSMNAHDDRNLNDISRYLLRRLTMLGKTGRFRVAGRSTDDIVSELADRSEGSFLYARHVVDALEREILSVEDLQKLPPGLNGLYERFFRRYFPTKALFGRQRCVLEALAAAQEPLDETMLAKATRLDIEDELPAVLEELSPYLHWRETSYGLEEISVFHKSLIDWLTDRRRRAKLHYASLEHGHRLLADACWEEYGKCVTAMSRYAKAHLPQHLVKSRQTTELQQLLTDVVYIEAKAEAGMIYALIADLENAVATLPDASNPTRTMMDILGEAMRRDASFIARHPQTLFQCLWNSCWWYGNPQAIQHYAGSGDGSGRTDLPTAGCQMQQLMEAWRVKRGEESRQVWLRSLRPPLMPLGSSQRAILRGHVGPVRAAAFSPDGHWVASASSDTTVRIWNVSNGSERLRIKCHSGKVDAVTFSPNGKHVASTSNDATVRVSDSRTGEQLYLTTQFDDQIRSIAFSPDSTRLVGGENIGKIHVWDVPTFRKELEISAHRSSVRSVRFSPDGARILSGSRDGTARVFDFGTGRELLVLEGHDGWILSAVYSYDGTRIATASADNTIRIWDSQTGEQLCRMIGHEDPVMTVAFSPDGHRCVSGSYDRTVRIWDVQSATQLVCLRCHDNAVLGVAYSPDSRYIVSASGDWTLRLWDANVPKDPPSLRGHTQSVAAVAFSPNGRYLASGGEEGNLWLWDADDGHQTKFMQLPFGGLNELAFSSDGQRIAACYRGGSIRVWDVETGDEIQSILTTSALENATFSPDGRQIVCLTSSWRVVVWDIDSGRELACWRVPRYLEGYRIIASTNGARLAANKTDNTVVIVDLCRQQELVLIGHQDEVSAIVWNPNRGLVATGSHDRTVRLWESDTGVEKTALLVDSPVYSVCFSPDGNRLASAADDGVAVWDVRTAKKLRELTGHNDRITCVAFSPDGELLASGSWDKTVRLWNAANGNQVRCFESDMRSVNCIAFSPDGTRLASGSKDASVRVWELCRDDVHCFAGHVSWVTSLAFSHDGHMLVSGSDDGAIRIWEAHSGNEISCFQGHRRAITSLEWHADGRTIISASRDGLVCIWDSITGHVRERQCQELLRPDRVVFSPDGRHIVAKCGSEQLVVWDASTGLETCARSIERPFEATDRADVPRFEFFTSENGLESVVRNSETGEEIAFFPVTARRIAAHPTWSRWALASGKHVYFVALEDINSDD